ncbi:plasmid pRiA4b ORF-3 family protein [Hymenobacter psychrophilus]|uniref:PRiA4b ORF-3-like protein n=1 Tax=Hymenobacter psychrophilus TaxID=651662 RepID=A0A1H3JHX0_9BACT|nr:plasmid pRiA4b ORF-3 family protein [Hymenobacter psychrophilus]SDY39516.1 pRiA4b ORF-3-like protein [Hymenobacter psychrophilus]
MANLLQLKASLRYTRPPVWRRVALPDTLTFWELHFVLQLLFDWENYHLWEFRQERGRGDRGTESVPEFVAMPLAGSDDDSDPEESKHDPRKAPLSTILATPGDTVTYTYDFGDYWQHDIVVEQLTPLLPEAARLESVRCLAGKRAAPPEDIGGPPGFENLLALLAEKAAGKRKRMPGEYAGLGKFDPAQFDLDRCNHNLTFLAEIITDYEALLSQRGAAAPRPEPGF